LKFAVRAELGAVVSDGIKSELPASRTTGERADWMERPHDATVSHIAISPPEGTRIDSGLPCPRTRGSMKVQFLGSGDAFGSGGRFNTCFFVQDLMGAFLVDCGASSMIAIRKFGVDPNSIRAVLITHLHGDHFGGLPFLILDAQLVSRRTAPLTIAGPPGLRDRLVAAMENFFPGSTKIERRFELAVRELEPHMAQNVEGIDVTPYIVKHPSGAPPFALRLTVDGKVLCYSGDTEWVDGLREAAEGADLLIAEAYFFDKKIKFHLDFSTLASRLSELGAKRVILTHMSAEMLTRVGHAGAEIAEDGLIISL
jgi:ribonuclease BN (tRNA processing enzyme)